MPVPADDPTFRIVYRSRVRIPVESRRAELGELFSAARSYNKAHQVTGALLLTDDWFVQTLEGDEPVVRQLLARIERDPRHDGLTLLEAQPVGQRVFARWSMARVADDGTSDIPLIAHVDGISPAAPRGDTTAEQAQVLAGMRAAATVAPAPATG